MTFVPSLTTPTGVLVIDDDATVHWVHFPDKHEPLAQGWPQRPQLAPLVWVFTHAPLQLVCPAGQEHRPLVHVPPVHVWPAPHAPQYVVDVLVFVSQPFEGTPSQSPKPLVHDAIPHTPLVQLAVASASEHGAQAPPPVPQLLGD
jgi:hypothetical protein